MKIQKLFINKLTKNTTFNYYIELYNNIMNQRLLLFCIGIPLLNGFI